MWQSRSFLAHARDTDDATINRWRDAVCAGLAAKRPGWDCLVVAGRDDYQARAEGLGGWSAWLEDAAVGCDFDGNPRYDEIIVPLPGRPDQGGRALDYDYTAGRATAEMIERCIDINKPVFAWFDLVGGVRPDWTGWGFVEVTGLARMPLPAGGKADWKRWASLVLKRDERGGGQPVDLDLSTLAPLPLAQRGLAPVARGAAPSNLTATATRVIDEEMRRRLAAATRVNVELLPPAAFSVSPLPSDAPWVNGRRKLIFLRPEGGAPPVGATASPPAAPSRPTPPSMPAPIPSSSSPPSVRRASAGAPSREVRDFVDDARELQELCLDLSDAKPTASNFFDSVGEKAANMAAWAEENLRVTERMLTSLANMRAGVERWRR